MDRVADNQQFTTRLIGGIFLGNLGGIVGAMSGVQSKEEKTAKRYIILNYEAANGEKSALSFDIDRASSSIYENFVDELKEKCGFVTQEPEKDMSL